MFRSIGPTLFQVVVVLAAAYWCFYIARPPGDAEAIVQSRPNLMSTTLRPPQTIPRDMSVERH
jgi:hypothetical protein